jgi:hypothetical protein
MTHKTIGTRLSKDAMKLVEGGKAPSGCYTVYSDQGYSSCWYSASGNALNLCERVYGSHCEATSNGPVSCNGCTMN